MTQAGLNHPDVAQLTAFVSGRLNAALSEEIEAHLSACEACGAVLEQLPDDSLSSLLHSWSTIPQVPNAPLRRAALPSMGPGDPGAESAFPSDSVAAAAGLQIPSELAEHPRYRVLDLIGVGGMGAVYKAEHRRMERLVALKVLRPKLVDNPAGVERFRREVKAAARLAHPNIVTAYDADQAGDAHFLVMEFVEGKSLAQVVAEEGPLPVARACEYARQAALGLQHACDRRMVHRDIKPHNLMLTPQGQVKILDFGLARFVREAGPTAISAGETLGADSPNPALSNPLARGGEEGSAGTATASGQVLGSADYIAPEQARDPRQADIRSDIYSLGCTLYFLLAGHSPFAGQSLTSKLLAHGEQTPESLAALRADVDVALEGVIERLMAKDPAQRFQRPAEVAEALTPFAKASFPAERRRWRLSRRQWTITFASGLGLLLLAVGVIFLAKLNAPDRIQVGSEWSGYFGFLPPIKGYIGNVRVVITERRGDAFKGTYATEDDQFEWEIEGTLDHGSIRWEFTRIIREKHPTHVVGSAIVEGHYEGKHMQLRFRHPYDNSEADLLMTQAN